MIFVVETGHGDVIERMWRTLVSARRNADTPEIWRLTDEIIASVADFYHLGREEQAERISRFLDIPVDPTTTAPHLLCYPNVIYHL